MQQPPINVPSEEYLRRKKRRTIKITIVVFIALVFFTFIETYIQQQRFPSSLFNTIIVFAFFNIIVILLCILLLLIFRNLIKLYFERKSNKIGAKFQTKLVLSFITLAFVPSVLLFFVASKLFSYSLDTWFNLQVENSLKESLYVAQSYYKNYEKNSIYYARNLAQTIVRKNFLAEENTDLLFNFIWAERVKYGIDAIKIFNKDRATVEIFNPELQGTQFLDDFSNLVQEGFKNVTTSEFKLVNKAFVVVGMSPIMAAGPKNVRGVVLVAYFIPKSMVSTVNEIKNTFEEYKQQKLLKYPVKTGYIMTFLMITLLILFSAIWFGFYLAKGITVPIQKLAEGTKAIARGNLDFKIDVKSNDEISILVDSFNQMADDLYHGKIKFEATAENLKKTNIELDEHGKYLEAVIDNIDAGVISIDQTGKITMINRGAVNILKIPAGNYRGKYYKYAFDTALLNTVRTLIKKMNKRKLARMEEQIEVTVKDSALTLLTKIHVLKNNQNKYLGMVIVFDDLTEFIRTQKIAAWREVARDIAHEIKNPLTPIQLNTQRLQKKFKTNSPDFKEVFEESTKVIVSEVNGMKELLNEFSNFAKMPASKPKPNSLHDIINEVIALYNGVNGNVKIVKSYDTQIKLINIDYEQIKRVFINLFDNAIEAMNNEGRIDIGTYLDKINNTVKIKISDCGEGINAKIQKKLFLPYFTTKKRGTGLGLAIANRIITDHNGTIKVMPNETKGVTFLLELLV